jgi:hypothetical protein
MSGIQVTGNVVYSHKTQGMLPRSIGGDKWQTRDYETFMLEPVGTRRLVFEHMFDITGMRYKYVISRTPEGVCQTTYMYQHDEVCPE